MGFEGEGGVQAGELVRCLLAFGLYGHGSRVPVEKEPPRYTAVRSMLLTGRPSFVCGISLLYVRADKGGTLAC